MIVCAAVICLFSPVLANACISTFVGVPEPVEIVEARTAGPQSAIVSWLPPHDAGSGILNYVVQLQKWPRVRCVYLH